jgi:hypothetical protein
MLLCSSAVSDQVWCTIHCNYGLYQVQACWCSFHCLSQLLRHLLRDAACCQALFKRSTAPAVSLCQGPVDKTGTATLKDVLTV